MPTKRRPTRRPDRGGHVRQLPSGRWQAKFPGPDGVTYPAPDTFDTKLDAGAWLDRQQHAVDRGDWTPATQARRGRGETLKEYAEKWLAERDLRPRTRASYRSLLDRLILPALGNAPLDTISPSTVRSWYAQLNPKTPTLRAQAYSLLRTIFKTAIDDEVVNMSNPCRIRAAGQSRTKHEAVPATLPELEVIVTTVPKRYRAMILLAAWCALRFGELIELRRGDVDLPGGVLRVRRGAARVDGGFIVGDPKSQAGKRTVAIPPHLIPLLETHLADHVGVEPGALLFPPAGAASHMQPSTLYKVWYPARKAAGRTDLRFHDLRHTGATLAAATGATLAELMARLGHSTPAAAMRYQHAAAARDQAIAEALSGFASAQVIPLVQPQKKAK